MSDRPEPRLGIHLVNFASEQAVDWSRLLAAAEAADQGGIDKLIVSDHVVFGERLDEYARPEIGGVQGGRQPTGPDGHWLEPLTLLAYVAGRTNRVRLATHVLLAALRRPIVLAKMLSTLDVLSEGRLDVGVGVGWQREEYHAAGLSFEDRGHLLDDCLNICTTVWNEAVATITPGPNPVERIHQMPKPVQPGGVPLWISGRASLRVARRLARFGTGWIPWGNDALDPASSIPRMRELVSEVGGDPAGLRVVGGLAPRDAPDGSTDLVATMDAAYDLIEAGVTDVVARIPFPDINAAEDVYGAWAEAFAQSAGR